MESPKKKPGPKLKQVDWPTFDGLCEIQCTLTELANWFDCDEKTIKAIVLREKGVEYSEYYEKKSSPGKISLRRKMFQLALSGDKTMLIYLSKQYLGMSDKIEQKVETNVIPEAPVTVEVLKEALKKDKFISDGNN